MRGDGLAQSYGLVCGHAARLGEKARGELRAAGETSDLRVPPTAELLTSQELHIVRLAAGGLSNREIAQ
ncbi:hypothetical protein [Streptosporangium sp. NPDC000509]|uniref:hypothetical protein n=1 Tax=Streptosporangium sp. NPDC000509 TaxID=3366186 RepID=UPI003691F065